MGYTKIFPVNDFQLLSSVQSAKDNDFKDSITSALQAETNERISADSAIINTLSAETKTRQSDTARLSAAIDNEIIARQTFQSNVTASLAAEQNARKTNDDALDDNFQSLLNEEKSLRLAADTALQTSLANEQSARVNADSSIRAEFDTKLGLQALQIGNLGSSLDTLNSSLDTLSGSLDTLSGSVDTLNSSLDNEADNRNQQFKSVGDAINAEINARKNAVDSLSAALSSLQAKVNDSDSLSSAINNEINTRKSETASLSSALTAETNQRIGADSLLQAQITSETSIRKSAIDSLKADFNSETNIRKSAIDSLKSYVDNNVSVLTSSDVSLAKSIADETKARKELFDTLNTSISNLDLATSGRLNTLADGLTALNNQLAAEETARKSADSALDTKIANVKAEFNSVCKVFTASTATKPGTSGFVPAPPATGDTDTVYYLTNKGWGEPVDIDVKIGIIPSQTGSVYYNGKTQEPQWDNYDPLALSITSETSGVNAGTYTVYFKPKDGFKWSDGSKDSMKVTWKILPKQITVPSANTTSFEYTGNSITLNVINYDSGAASQTGTTSATNKGNYTAKYELKSTANYVWSDGTTAAKTIAWAITPKLIAVPTVQNTSFTYDGNSHAPTVSNLNSTYAAQSGTASATNAGSYTLTFSLKDTTNTAWASATGTNDGTANRLVTWIIGKAALTAKQSAFTASKSLSYNGSVQSAVSLIASFDSTVHVASSTTSATNAGTYTVKIAPDSNHTWRDGTTAAKSVSWTIAPLWLVKPTLETTSFTYDGNSKAPTLKNFNSAYESQTGTTSATGVADYSITVSLKSTTNTKWADGSTANETLSWSIVKGNGITKPTLASNSFEWTGGNISPTINNYSATTMTKSGSDTATAVASYSIKISLKDKTNTQWADGSTADVSLTWSITRRILTKPTLASSSFDFNGSSKSVTVNNYNSTYESQTGTTSATNAGTYTVTFTLKNTSNCRWADSTTSAVNLTWTINRQKLTAAQSTFAQSGTLTYNGSSQNVTISNYNSTYHDLTSTTSATNAGSYTAKVEPKSNYAWSDGATAAKNVSWSIGKKTLTQPTLTNATYTYDGNEHSPTINNYDSDTMNQTGTIKATNAGTYTLTFSLKDTNNTQFTGSATSQLHPTWVINKAASTLTLSSDQQGNLGVAYSFKSLSDEYKVKYVTEGGTSLEFSIDCDTIVKASYKNGVITITAGEYLGHASVNVRVAESTNYAASAWQYIPIYQSNKHYFSDASWDEIARVFDPNSGSSPYPIGSSKDIGLQLKYTSYGVTVDYGTTVAVFLGVKYNKIMLYIKPQRSINDVDCTYDIAKALANIASLYLPGALVQHISGTQLPNNGDLGWYMEYGNYMRDFWTTEVLANGKVRTNGTYNDPAAAEKSESRQLVIMCLFE